MGWAVGWDQRWQRHIGYGVPAVCDHPECSEEIDRGLSYVCGEPFGGEHGCGLFFCAQHRQWLELAPDGDVVSLCERCADEHAIMWFDPKPDVPEWMRHLLTDESWQPWRDDNPSRLECMAIALGAVYP